jgi:hypothetical protein
MNPEASLTLRVSQALRDCEIPYLLAGSFASNFYGIPRSTKDADFVIHLDSGVGADFGARLGDDFELDPQLSFETVTGTYRQYVRHKKKKFKIELFLLSKDAHDQERFKRRREQELFGQRVWFLSPEDVIVSKLRWARGKDEEDLRNVIIVQRGKLDWPYIEKWSREHGTLAKLEKIRRTVSEI